MGECAKCELDWWNNLVFMEDPDRRMGECGTFELDCLDKCSTVVMADQDTDTHRVE